MRDVGQNERRAIWEEVRREFPDDELMQELHFVRRLHQLRTEGLSPAELIAFYHGAGSPKRSSASGGERR